MEEQEQRPIDEMSFRDASIELEQIVRALELNDLELEDALGRYARGVELLKSLRERLATAEQKVQLLADATETNVAVADTTAAPSTAFINE